jgi:hypothetical protein
VYQPIGNIAQKRLYLDGRLDGESEASLPRLHNKKSVWLGANSVYNDREFSGLIDEVAIFGRALKPKEILEFFEAGKPGDSDN